MKTMETVEPGIYRRVDPRNGKVLSKLWIHYPGPGSVTIREPTHTRASRRHDGCARSASSSTAGVSQDAPPSWSASMPCSRPT
jgi:hypothetical protein